MAVVQELLTKIGFQVDKNSVSSAQSSIDNVIKGLKQAAVALGAIKTVKFFDNLIQETAVVADTFDKMGKRLGVTSGFLQEMDLVANLAGTTSKELEVAMRRLQLSLDKAATGTKEFVDSFERLGIEQKDIIGPGGTVKSLEELLPLVADKFKNLESATTRTALAQILMGRGGTSLIPVFLEGSRVIALQQQEVRELGGVIDDDLKAASLELIDNQARMKVVFLGVKNAITKGLIPAVRQFQRSTIAFFKSSDGQIFRSRLTEFFGELHRGILSLLKTVSGMTRSLISFTLGMSTTEKAIAGISIAVVALTKILALPFAPLLLISAALLLIIDDWETFKEGGESTIGFLLKEFPAVAQTIFAVASVIQAAFQLLWETLKTIGKRIGQFFGAIFFTVSEMFRVGFVEGLIRGFRGVFNNLIEDAISFANRIIKVINRLPSFIKSGFGIDGDINLLTSTGLNLRELQTPKAVSARQPSVQSSMTNNIEIKAGPNTDPVAIGNEVVAQLDRREEDALRQSGKALTNSAQ